MFALEVVCYGTSVTIGFGGVEETPRRIRGEVLWGSATRSTTDKSVWILILRSRMTDKPPASLAKPVCPFPRKFFVGTKKNSFEETCVDRIPDQRQCKNIVKDNFRFFEQPRGESLETQFRRCPLGTISGTAFDRWWRSLPRQLAAALRNSCRPDYRKGTLRHLITKSFSQS